MIKVANREGKEVIDINCSLITRVCDARNRLENILFIVEKHNPEAAQGFKENVCNLINDLYFAFLRADED